MSEWNERKKAWVPDRRRPCSDDIRDVIEGGPIVGALVSVFKQLDDMGAKRNGRE